MSHWVSPEARTTFTFASTLDATQWRTLEGYILAYMLQEGMWPSTVRLEAGGATHVHLRTGASWSGRFEADICTIIRQVTTATEE